MEGRFGFVQLSVLLVLKVLNEITFYGSYWFFIGLLGNDAPQSLDRYFTCHSRMDFSKQRY
jgi:hypothetical protein